jgi:hypothetical protein
MLLHCLQGGEGEISHFDEGVPGSVPLTGSYSGPYAQFGGSQPAPGFVPLGSSPLDSAVDLMVRGRERDTTLEEVSEDSSMDQQGGAGGAGAGGSGRRPPAAPSTSGLTQQHPHGTRAAARRASTGTAAVVSLAKRSVTGPFRDAHNAGGDPGSASAAATAGDDADTEGPGGAAVPMDVEDELAEMADALLLLHESA